MYVKCVGEGILRKIYRPVTQKGAWRIEITKNYGNYKDKPDLSGDTEGRRLEWLEQKYNLIMILEKQISQ
jgi:hypothetical protein